MIDLAHSVSSVAEYGTGRELEVHPACLDGTSESRLPGLRSPARSETEPAVTASGVSEAGKRGGERDPDRER